MPRRVHKFIRVKKGRRYPARSGTVFDWAHLVDAVGSVGGGEHEDVPQRLDAVHLGEQLRQHPVRHVAGAAPGPATRGQRVRSDVRSEHFETLVSLERTLFFFQRLTVRCQGSGDSKLEISPAPLSCERVDFVEEDDGGSCSPRSAENLPHRLLRLAHPFGEEL